MSEQLSLRYAGGPVDDGRMDAYEVAAAILAFSEFLNRAGRTAYGEKMHLATEIQGFRQNCFDIQFAVDMAGVTASVLSGVAPTAKDLVDLAKQALELFKHLRGQPPREVTPQEGNQAEVMIRNQDGHMQYFKADVINIIADPRSGEAVQGFIGKQLNRGIKSVSINDKAGQALFQADQSEASYYRPVDIEQPLSKYDVKMGLIIEAPVFKEGNKWKFSDGQSSFWASIEDKSFIRAVESGEKRFGMGDVLLAMVRVEQTAGLSTLNVKRTVLEVLEHRESMRQAGMPLG